MRRFVAKRGKRPEENIQRPLPYEKARSRTLGWDTKPRVNVNSFKANEFSLETLLEQSTSNDVLYPDAYTDLISQKPPIGPWTNTPQFHNDINEDPYPYVPETEVSQELWEKYSDISIQRYNTRDWIDHRYKIAKRIEDPEIANKIMGLLSEPIFELVPLEELHKLWRQDMVEAYRKKQEQARLEAEAAEAAAKAEQEASLAEAEMAMATTTIETEAETESELVTTQEDSSLDESTSSNTNFEKEATDNAGAESSTLTEGETVSSNTTATENAPETTSYQTPAQTSAVADPDLVEEPGLEKTQQEIEDEAVTEQIKNERPILFNNDGEEPTFEDVLMNNADHSIFDMPPTGDEDMPPALASPFVELFEKHLMNLREQKEIEDQLSLTPRIKILSNKEAKALVKREDFYRKLNAERLNFLSQTEPEDEIKEIIDFHRKAAKEWTQSKIIKFYIEKRKTQLEEEFEQRKERIASEMEERYLAERDEKYEKAMERKPRDEFDELDRLENQDLPEEEEKSDEDLAKEMDEENAKEKEHDKVRKFSPRDYAKFIAQQAAKDIVQIGNDLTVQDTQYFSFGMESSGTMEDDGPKRYQKIVDEDGAFNLIEAMWNDGVWEYEDFKSEYRKPYVLRDIRKSREKRDLFQYRMENTLKYYYFLRKSGQLR